MGPWDGPTVLFQQRVSLSLSLGLGLKLLGEKSLR